MTIETSSTPRRSGRWLLVATLVLGGLLFLGQYLGLVAMNLVRLFGTVREPVLRSPDGAWDAFVSRYVYGPEDVVIVAAGEDI